jgi:hypothetical protein
MTREADPSVVRRCDDVMCVDDLLRPFFADEPSDCVCPVCSELAPVRRSSSGNAR